MRAVCVIGLGLIGGSVLRAAAAAGRPAWGATASEEDAATASSDGADAGTDVPEALRRAAGQDAIVVVAVPVTSVPRVMALVAEHAPDCLVTDVVSVKEPVLEQAERRGLTYVGGHPMAGTSRSGWAAGSAELFRGAAWVVTAEADTDPVAWREVAALALDCGAHVVPAGAAQHDAAVARISHLPHVLAAVLAACGAEGGPLALALAAGSYGDGTRVAGSRPELVAAMCEANRSALLDAVDDALGRLGAARGALASTGSLKATVEAGHVGRLALDRHRAGPGETLTVDLDRPDALDELLDLGARGARVRGLDGARALVEVPPEV